MRLAATILAWGLVCASATYGAEKNLVPEAAVTPVSAVAKDLQALAEHPSASGTRFDVQSVGTSRRGQPIWMIRVARSGPSDAPRRIVYVCRQHGHEPASTEGALLFLAKLHALPPEAPLIQQLRASTLYVIPMANPDGARAFLRHNAADVDLNRDWLARTQPETRAIWHVLQDHKPTFITDQHELYPSDPTPDFTETVRQDGGAQVDVARRAEALQSAVGAEMRQDGFPVTAKAINDNHPPRLLHRYGCIRLGVPTLLFETNRTPARHRALADRAAAHELFMEAVLLSMDTASAKTNS